MNKNYFIGSITPQEAKHVIFKHCLKSGKFNKFDEARFAY
jgi:hypothetical protein